MKLTNWGNYPIVDAGVSSFNSEAEVERLVSELRGWIPRGLGRCYGDSSLGESVVSTLKFNRFLNFDSGSGVLHCQAGVSIAEILEYFVPKGWFPPVTPGTKFITVGGAIASDVHGKNHHSEGSWSNHLISFRLITPDGEIRLCSREENPDLFWATCGGMGLTGIVVDATFKLKPVETSYIKQTSMRTRTLEEVFTFFEENKDATYSVAWIDCLAKGKNTGRSLVLLGEHAKKDELVKNSHQQDPFLVHPGQKLNVPFNLPGFAINTLTVKMFNWMYYRRVPRKLNTSIIHYDPYFYPLDAIENWNRLYGKKGFTQYQFVLPMDKSFDGLVEILGLIAKKGMGSPLSVLKFFGKQDGMLAFPMEGYTLALDFPIRKSLFPFLDQLDEIVHKNGGRIYLTKDCRLTPETLKKGYPRLNEFLEIRKGLSQFGNLKSTQSERLGI